MLPHYTSVFVYSHLKIQAKRSYNVVRGSDDSFFLPPLLSSTSLFLPSWSTELGVRLYPVHVLQLTPLIAQPPHTHTSTLRAPGILSPPFLPISPICAHAAPCPAGLLSDLLPGKPLWVRLAAPPSSMLPRGFCSVTAVGRWHWLLM